jgi:hypothetical protein
MGLSELMLGNAMGSDVTDLIDVNNGLRGNSACPTPDATPGGWGRW